MGVGARGIPDTAEAMARGDQRAVDAATARALDAATLIPTPSSLARLR